MRRQVIVEADGGSRGNPGPAGYGAVVFDADSGEVLAERNESLGVQTNNFAEYNGLIAGLRAAAELGATSVTVQMDSKLVVEQMKGTWQAKHAGMRALRDEALELALQFEQIRYRWIPRERNKYADRLANEAMDRAAGIEPKPRKAAAEPVAPAPSPSSTSESPAANGTSPASSVSATEATAAAVGPQPTAAASASPSWVPSGGVPTRLILVRHGSTAHSPLRLLSGRNDLPLSAEGEVQAESLRLRLRRIPDVAAVVSSPLPRCLQTAQIIAGSAKVRVVPAFAELDFGVWEGLSMAEVTSRWSAEFAEFSATGETPAPNGESFAQVAARVRRGRDDLISNFPGQTVVVVTHVTPIKTLLRLALGAPHETLFRIHLDTASVSIIDYFADGNASVRLVNDTSHLSRSDEKAPVS
ncbi:probable phosphoglycerate mutase [Frankineae bacterium MT45]|nr:probable phosphoglycerate mutase [Frankineae bacterium MT45]